MGKTIKILSTLICIGGISLVSSSTFATSEEYWHIGELNNFNTEIRSEIEAECLGDIMCEEEKYYELAENQGGKYAALYQFLSYGQFLISGINPDTGKVSIYYSDTDFMMMDESEKFDLTEMYLFWLDDGMYHNDNREIYTYAKEMKEGTPREGVHVVVAKNNTTDGEGWFVSNQEMEFDAKTDLNSMKLPLRFFTVSAGVSIGSQKFEDCFNSVDYAPGKECRAVFTATGRKYLPLDPNALNNTIVTEATEEDIPVQESTPELDSQPENTATVVEDVPTAVEVEDAPTTAVEDDTTTAVEIEDTIIVVAENMTKSESNEAMDATTPNIINSMPIAKNIESVEKAALAAVTTTTSPTGKLDDELTNNINLKSGTKRDFPWGLILMMSVISVILLWWFLPFSNKKSKKSIDKSDSVE